MKSFTWRSGVVVAVAATGMFSAGAAVASSSGAGAGAVTTVANSRQNTASPGGAPLNAVPAVGRNAVSYKGEGFDACSAPTEAQMAAWRASSPYDAIGINIGGANRACSQPNLTAQWVQDEAKAGWHFFLLYAGPQAPGTVCKTCTTITSPASQADTAAADAVDQASVLGFQPGTPIFYDVQDYTDGGTDTTSVLAFLSDWTADTSARGYTPAVRGAMNSAVHDLVANYTNTSYSLPVQLDFASADGQQSTDNAAIPATDWAYHERVNQNSSTHPETWASTTLTIDSDYLDLQSPGFTPSQSTYVINPDNSVSELVGDNRWFDIGGSATDVYVELMHVFATFQGDQGIFEFDPDTAAWTRIGGPGAQFAIAQNSLFGLAPDRSHVYRWAGTDGVNSWTAVGGAASAIYGGQVGLVATNALNTAANLYISTSTGMAWHHIGGGGAQFAESYDTIFALTADRTHVYQWSGKGTSWTQIGGAAQSLYADAIDMGSGGNTLYASSPGNRAVYNYTGKPGQWLKAGGPGAAFADCNGQLLGLNSVGGDLYKYLGPWLNIGGPFNSVHCQGTE